MNKEMQQVAQCSGQGEKLYRLAGRLIVLLALLVFSSRGALAQLSTADIVGTVTDSLGAVIPKATVTLVNLDTHDQRVAVSNDSGDFQFTLLPVGHYSVTAKAKGFKTRRPRIWPLKPVIAPAPTSIWNPAAPLKP
jgi:hypothetical protein